MLIGLLIGSQSRELILPIGVVDVNVHHERLVLYDFSHLRRYLGLGYGW